MPGGQTGQATNKENGILRQINRNEEQGHGRNRMKDGEAGQGRGMFGTAGLISYSHETDYSFLLLSFPLGKTKPNQTLGLS